MAKSKGNFGGQFSASTVILLVAIIIVSSSDVVSGADSLTGRTKSLGRAERSAAAFPRRRTGGLGDGTEAEGLHGYMDSMMTRFHPVEPEARPYERRLPPRPTIDTRRPPPTKRIVVPRPSASCACDEGRLTRMDEQIASLLEKTNELTTQTAESRSNIASMMVNNRQLRSQMSQMMREKQALEKEARFRQIRRASSLTQDNERLRAENERLQVELLQASAGDDREAAEAVATLGSSLRELNDVVGNREAELSEMGLPVPVGRRPQGGPGYTLGRPSGGQWSAYKPQPRRPEPAAENFASLLLASNTEIRDMSRKVEQLERMVMEQQRGLLQDGMARPQFRQAPHHRESGQVSEKIAQLERLVLVALGSQPGGAAAAGERLASRPVISPHHGGQMRPQLGATERREKGPPRPPTMLAIADTMSDEDLDAMANVVERVQNKSPRKCAFSVASTGTTLGTDENPLPIQFDHEFVNKGGDFKMNRNRFVCEHAGFYFITFTVRSYDGKYLGVALMKNEDMETAIYTDASDRNVMQSQSVITHLESGDELWLRIAPSRNYAVHSGVHRYVTFSGFLVYRGS